ncbi:autotransporter domain-containing protein [Niveispirillum sp. KHB5.9]|uniref:autotransporter domain-containing protein n=1 Tax=Niveispirillum sp. KHB5.9 TaxID=3400269 RepID=UPI003A86FEC9
MSKKLLGGTALAAVLSLSAIAMDAPAAKAQGLDISSLVVFGDSLSDTDNLKNLNPASRPGTPYVNGRFSNGPVWLENLGTLTGITTSSRAYGGARATRTTAIDLTAQVDAYLTGGTSIPASRAVGIWIGGNDYIAVLTTPQANPTAAAQTAIAATTGAITAQAGRLYAAGARQFVLFNLPPLGSIPLTSSLSAADKASANTVSDLHTQAIKASAATLRAQGATVTVVDVQTLFQGLVASPSTYGFTNVTTPCYAPIGPGGSLVATGVCATAAGAAGTVFFDALHPTTAAHQMIAQYAYGTMSATYEAPAALAISTDAAQRLLDLANEGVSARMAGARTGQGSVNVIGAQAGQDDRFGMFVFGSYVDGDRDEVRGQFGYEYDGFNAGLGFDYQVDQHVVAGLAFSYGNLNVDTDDAYAKLDATAYNLTAYITAAADDFWMDTTLSYSFDDYKSDRTTRFTPFANAHGDYKGNTYALGTTVGFTPVAGSFAMGPVIGLRYAKSRVEGFADEGAGPLALTWDDFDAESLLGSVGGQISGVGTSFVPQVRVAYEYEFKNDSRAITGRFANGELAWTDPGAGKRGRLAVGAGLVHETAENVAVAVSYNGHFAGGDRTDHALTAHMKIGF